MDLISVLLLSGRRRPCAEVAYKLQVQSGGTARWVRFMVRGVWGCGGVTTRHLYVPRLHTWMYITQ